MWRQRGGSSPGCSRRCRPDYRAAAPWRARSAPGSGMPATAARVHRPSTRRAACRPREKPRSMSVLSATGRVRCAASSVTGRGRGGRWPLLATWGTTHFCSPGRTAAAGDAFTRSVVSPIRVKVGHFSPRRWCRQVGILVHGASGQLLPDARWKAPALPCAIERRNVRVTVA